MTRFNNREDLKLIETRLSPLAIKRGNTHAKRLGISRGYLIEVMLLMKAKDLTRTEIKKKGLL